MKLLDAKSSSIHPRRFLLVGATCATLFSCLFTQGCSSTGRRANDKTAALGKLSPADRQLAMAGSIHNGFTKDAVYVAWGAPSKMSTNNTSRGVQESWTYIQTFNGYGGGYYGVSRGLVHGKNGDHYSTDNFYPAPDTAQTLGGTSSTDVPVKRVVFENGRVVSYEPRLGQIDNSVDDEE